MEKGSTKTIGILFVIILIVLLGAHLMTLRNVKTEFSQKESAFKQQITDLNAQLDKVKMENQALTVKLELKKIMVEVVRTNFGSAREDIATFKDFLKKSGCKKMDQLEPVFEQLDTDLLKKSDTNAIAALDKIQEIIFSEKAETPAETQAQPETE